MADESTLWRVGGASVTGAAHVRRGAGDQDAWLCEPASGAAERFLIAVADGHGAAPHYRSDIGSRFAVEAAREAVEWHLDAPDGAGLADDIVEIWRSRVRDHIARHPLEHPAGGPELAPYGSTLIVVAATPVRCTVLQIGDGDLMLGYPDGRIVRPLPRDRDLTGEQTYSLCMDNAVEYVKYRLLERTDADSWPDFALIATDGVSKSFVDDPAFEQVVTSYRELVQSEAQLQSTLAALPAWLEEVSATGSGDDATLCLATRRRWPR